MAHKTYDKPVTVGVIDIGSNSVRLVIYEQHDADFTPIFNEKILAGLGRNLNITGKLHPQGAKLAFAALKRFKLLTDGLEISRVLIAATAALRDADDAHIFIEKVKTEIGYDISPLSGEREAYISAMGTVAGDVRACGLAADLGGASLELISIKDRQASGGISYPLGPFSLYKGAFEPQILRAKIEKAFGAGPSFPKGQRLYLIGGAWRNLALVHQQNTGYPLQVAHNYEIGPVAAQALVKWAVSKEGVDALLSWPGISPRRAETLPYAGLMLGVLLEKLAPSQIIIAPGGLRDGLLYDSLSAQQLQRSALFDACCALAIGNQEGVDFGDPLFVFLKDVAVLIRPTFSEGNENRLRRAACLLGGIGKGLHPDHKARMVFRTVLYAPLPDLTHKERAYLALMLLGSYTSKKSTPKEAVIAYLLTPEEQSTARLYGEAMRLGTALAGRSPNVLSKMNLRANSNSLALDIKSGYEALAPESAHERLQNLALALGVSVTDTRNC